VYEQASARASQYGIPGVTLQLTQGVVKNIIPAIASTNAIVSAACVLEALKMITMCSTGLNNYMMWVAMLLGGSVMGMCSMCCMCWACAGHVLGMQHMLQRDRHVLPHDGHVLQHGQHDGHALGAIAAAGIAFTCMRAWCDAPHMLPCCLYCWSCRCTGPLGIT
jgi:hypothetical protein